MEGEQNARLALLMVFMAGLILLGPADLRSPAPQSTAGRLVDGTAWAASGEPLTGLVASQALNGLGEQIEGVTVLSSSYHQDAGFLYLVGEVRNDTSGNVTDVVVRATYFDDKDELLGGSSAYIEHTILVPGQISPFVIVDVFPSGLSWYELSVGAWPTAQQPAGPLPVLSLLERRTAGGGLLYVGELQNTLGVSVRHTKVMLTFYDDLGRVVNVQSDYAPRDLLLPGDKSPFRIWVLSGPTDYASRAIRVDAVHSDDVPPDLHSANVGYRVDSAGRLVFSGQVRNRGGTQADLVRAIITLYDTVGDVIHCAWSLTEPSTIAPGGAAAFEVVISEGYEGWSSYSLYPPEDVTPMPTPTLASARREVYLPLVRRGL